MISLKERTITLNGLHHLLYCTVAVCMCMYVQYVYVCTLYSMCMYGRGPKGQEAGCMLQFKGLFAKCARLAGDQDRGSNFFPLPWSFRNFYDGERAGGERNREQENKHQVGKAEDKQGKENETARTRHKWSTPNLFLYFLQLLIFLSCKIHFTYTVL